MKISALAAALTTTLALGGLSAQDETKPEVATPTTETIFTFDIKGIAG